MNQMVQNVCDFFDLKGMNYNVLKEGVLEIVFTGTAAGADILAAA